MGGIMRLGVQWNIKWDSRQNRMVKLNKLLKNFNSVAICASVVVEEILIGRISQSIGLQHGMCYETI